MRELDDALKALSEFESLVRYGLYPSKPLEKVERKDQWDSLYFASLEFKVGQLTVEVYAHVSDRSGFLNVMVWDFSEPSGNASKFDMGADAEFAARVVVDYLNGYEATV